MSEMIERVAKALRDKNPQRVGVGPFEDMSDRNKDYWRLNARIALEAMREPTEKVEDAARGLWLWYGGGRQPGWTLGKHSKTGGYGLSLTPEEAELDHCPKHVCGRIAWRTMIDEALK